MNLANRVFRRWPCQACGKHTYETRTDARRAAKTLHPGEHGLRAYRCERGGGGWHFGHLRNVLDQLTQTPTETPSQNPARTRTEPT